MQYICETCGKEFIRYGNNKPAKYCSQGCYGKAKSIIGPPYLTIKHGHTTNNKTSSTYSKWQGMKTRCYNTKSNRYKYYGGKGIGVCGRWLESFENFLTDMGICPQGMTLDRIDSNKGYAPENCRWVDLATQSRNRTNVKQYTIKGKTQCLNQWVKELGVTFNKAKRLLSQGFTIKEALGIS